MRAKVQKWGDTLAIRIPEGFAAETKLAEDSPVDISVRQGELVVAPVAEPALSLGSLISRITPENRHSEADMGGAVGNEVW